MPLTATWRHLQAVVVSEVSQTEKEKYHTIFSILCSIVYWNKKNDSKIIDSNKLFYQTETDLQT